MMVQENVSKMAIMTLSSKLYLQRTTFVSVKKSPVSQLLFLGNCHGHEREGVGWGSGGQRSTAGCCFLAEILLSIHRGHKQDAHEHVPQVFVVVAPLQHAGFFPAVIEAWGWCGFIPLGPGCSQTHTSSWEMLGHNLHPAITPIAQHLNHVAFCTPYTVVALRKRGEESRKEPIPAVF